MENVIAICAGLALRAVIDNLTDNDHRLTSTLIGLWEGIVLSHFLQKNPRNSSDAYLALVTRFAIDFLITSSVVRFVLTGVWTVVGLLLADIAPSVWRETGLRHVYRRLRKDAKAMQRAMPQWRIENDIKVPNISISNPVPGLFSRPPPSTIVSSTRAAPPTSPAPIPGRRRPPSPASQVTSSRTNTLTREVLPGASPAFIPTADNPASFDLDSYSHRTSLLSNSSGIDSSRHDPILIPDEVHIVIPSHSQEQVQVQDPELSALDILPPIAAVEVTTANVEIVSPTPLMSIQVLPIIPDIDLSIPAHQVSLPPSRPASRIDTTGVTGISQGRVRTLVEKFGSDQGPDFGKPYMSQQRASSTGVLGQGQNHSVDTRPGSTGHQRSDLSSRRREGSMLRPIDGNWRRGVILDGERTTEHTLSDSPGTETFIGGFFIRDRQTPQRSGTPREQSGSGGAPPSSALGLNTTFSPSKAPTPSQKPRSTSVSLIKPPTPGPQTRLTTPAPHTKSDKAESRSKTPIPVPPSKSTTPKPPSKSTTPIPKSDRATPDPTSSTHRATDYNPAEPVRPMPGLKSPSTEPDSIFGGPRPRAYASGDFDTNEYDVDDVPPPKYESPVNTQGEGLGETNGRQEEVAEDGAQQVVVDDNTGEAGGIDVEEAGDGTQGGGETSQGAGEHTQGGGQNTTKLPENASEKMGDNQEQDVNKPEEKKDEQGGDDNQGAVNDSQATDKVTQVADKPESTSVAGGDTEGADGHTEVNQPKASSLAPASEPSSKPEPILLTPEQKEAETHRAAFLRKEVTRLEASKLVSDGAGLPKIQARVDALKERIVRTNFTDPPDPLPLVPEFSSAGKNPTELLDELTNTIVDLLIKRQDTVPVQVRVTFAKVKKTKVDKTLKEFITENNFAMRSDSADGQFATMITV